MIILDKPYISNELKNYLQTSQIPVLKTDISISETKNYSLNLVNQDEFSKLYNENSRLYTLSENSIEWVKKSIDDKNLVNAINIMKNKYKFRKKISSLYPNFYFKTVLADELESLVLDNALFPLILKPAIGFFSAGVYFLNSMQDLKDAIKDIKQSFNKWQEIYPTSVIGEKEFILEQYIFGDEYAIDAYFDNNGKAVVLNIMQHEFTNEADVSDRLYYTSKEIIQNYVEKFEAYLNKINQILNIKNFPFHVEIRVNEKEDIFPIEFNPLRFAGWSTTDITYFAFGFFTYDYYFNNIKPNWEELLKNKDNIKFALILLDKPSSYNYKDDFDFELLKKSFTKVLCTRELEYKKKENPFGFLFTQTAYNNLNELENISKSNFSEYIISIV